MDFNPIANSRAYGVGAAAETKRGDQMGKDEFLKLLVAEMSNQDPLEPASGSDYVAQLAQFSSVEQLVQLNATVGVQGTSLAQMVEGVSRMSSNQNSLVGASSLIGRQVESTTGEGLLVDGTIPSFHVDMPVAAEKAELVIRNNVGDVVRRIALDGLGKGTTELDWDGLTDSGTQAPEGLYFGSVEATDASGESIKSKMMLSGEVTRVGLTKAGLTAWIGNLAIPVASLTSVAAK